jgi:serine/threonine-protein kinase
MALFEAALDRDVADRPAFVAAACGADADLLREVEALLAAAADASGFLERAPSAAFRAAAFARGAVTNRPPSPTTARPESDVELLERLQRALDPAYRVERELAGGGMSRVFVAEETRLGRRVVVKLLPPELARGLDVERFHREVRLAATLRHPHIVPLLTAGESDDGLFYYTMPYIEGESLRARLERDGPLPAPDAARVVREVADALAYAQRRGVVHRDVKPANVLVDGDHVLVSDFGIAKALSAATDAPPDAGAAVPGGAAGAMAGGAATRGTLTARGFVLGTPAYMSPEQARGDAVDGRSDVYSLGLMAFEMPTGERPTAVVTPRAEPGVPLPPHSLPRVRPELPGALDAVIARALAPDPAGRFQTADELARALDDALAGPMAATLAAATPAAFAEAESAAPTGRGRRTPRRRAVALAVGALAALGVAGASLRRPRRWRRARRARRRRSPRTRTSRSTARRAGSASRPAPGPCRLPSRSSSRAGARPAPRGRAHRG